MKTPNSRPATPAIPDNLKNFDSLPSAANVRLPVVQALFSCSAATVWRMVARGTLKTRKMSERVTTFNVGDLRAVMAVQGGENE
jgi:predicted DNA-binding transcriptional regulator AlpA